MNASQSLSALKSNFHSFSWQKPQHLYLSYVSPEIQSNLYPLGNQTTGVLSGNKDTELDIFPASLTARLSGQLDVSWRDMCNFQVTSLKSSSSSSIYSFPFLKAGKKTLRWWDSFNQGAVDNNLRDGRTTRQKKQALAAVAQWIERGLQTKGLPVQFPVRSHAWVAGQVSSGGHMRDNHTLIFLPLSFSLPYLL